MLALHFFVELDNSCYFVQYHLKGFSVDSGRALLWMLMKNGKNFSRNLRRDYIRESYRMLKSSTRQF